MEFSARTVYLCLTLQHVVVNRLFEAKSSAQPDPILKPVLGDALPDGCSYAYIASPSGAFGKLPHIGTSFLIVPRSLMSCRVHNNANNSWLVNFDNGTNDDIEFSPSKKGNALTTAATAASQQHAKLERARPRMQSWVLAIMSSPVGYDASVMTYVPYKDDNTDLSQLVMSQGVEVRVRESRAMLHGFAARARSRAYGIAVAMHIQSRLRHNSREGTVASFAAVARAADDADGAVIRDIAARRLQVAIDADDAQGQRDVVRWRALMRRARSGGWAQFLSTMTRGSDATAAHTASSTAPAPTYCVSVGHPTDMDLTALAASCGLSDLVDYASAQFAAPGRGIQDMYGTIGAVPAAGSDSMSARNPAPGLPFNPMTPWLPKPHTLSIVNGVAVALHSPPLLAEFLSNLQRLMRLARQQATAATKTVASKPSLLCTSPTTASSLVVGESRKRQRLSESIPRKWSRLSVVCSNCSADAAVQDPLSTANGLQTALPSTSHSLAPVICDRTVAYHYLLCRRCFVYCCATHGTSEGPSSRDAIFEQWRDRQLPHAVARDALADVAKEHVRTTSPLTSKTADSTMDADALAIVCDFYGAAGDGTNDTGDPAFSKRIDVSTGNQIRGVVQGPKTTAVGRRQGRRGRVSGSPNLAPAPVSVSPGTIVVPATSSPSKSDSHLSALASARPLPSAVVARLRSQATPVRLPSGFRIDLLKSVLAERDSFGVSGNLTSAADALVLLPPTGGARTSTQIQACSPARHVVRDVARAGPTESTGEHTHQNAESLMLPDQSCHPLPRHTGSVSMTSPTTTESAQRGIRSSSSTNDGILQLFSTPFSRFIVFNLYAMTRSNVCEVARLLRLPCASVAAALSTLEESAISVSTTYTHGGWMHCSSGDDVVRVTRAADPSRASLDASFRFEVPASWATLLAVISNAATARAVTIASNDLALHFRRSIQLENKLARERSVRDTGLPAATHVATLLRNEFRRIGVTHTTGATAKPSHACTHAGPCQPDGQCECANALSMCTVLCNCDALCTRRHTGCRGSCAVGGCRTDTCRCFIAEVECDPALCTSCCAADAYALWAAPGIDRGVAPPSGSAAVAVAAIAEASANMETLTPDDDAKLRTLFVATLKNRYRKTPAGAVAAADGTGPPWPDPRIPTLLLGGASATVAARTAWITACTDAALAREARIVFSASPFVCGNTGVGAGAHARTFMRRSDAPSRIVTREGSGKQEMSSGWGLFAGEPVQEGDLLHEYTGEIISGAEAERRGQFYDKCVYANCCGSSMDKRHCRMRALRCLCSSASFIVFASMQGRRHELPFRARKVRGL